MKVQLNPMMRNINKNRFILSIIILRLDFLRNEIVINKIDSVAPIPIYIEYSPQPQSVDGALVRVPIGEKNASKITLGLRAGSESNWLDF